MIKWFDIKVLLLRKYIRFKQKQIKIQCFETRWDRYVIRKGDKCMYESDSGLIMFFRNYINDTNLHLVVYDTIYKAGKRLKGYRYQIGKKIINDIRDRKKTSMLNKELSDL